MATAGRSVAFSGVTVAIGLLSLIVLPAPALRSIGFGGILVPAVARGERGGDPDPDPDPDPAAGGGDLVSGRGRPGHPGGGPGGRPEPWRRAGCCAPAAAAAFPL